jgi:hypothetical protein
MIFCTLEGIVPGNGNHFCRIVASHCEQQITQRKMLLGG